MWFWACPTHAGACFVVCCTLTLLPLVAATGRRGAVIYTAALCLIVSALRQRSCGKAAVRLLHQRCPQAAPPFLLRTKSCLSPFLGGSSVGFTPHRRPWGYVTAGAYCHRIPQLRRPEPWCVLPRRPEELRCVALRCQADEHTAPSRPTAPRFAPSRFTASTAGALLRGGWLQRVCVAASGGGRAPGSCRARHECCCWLGCRTPCRLRLGRVAPWLGRNAAGASLGAGWRAPPAATRAQGGAHAAGWRTSDLSQSARRVAKRQVFPKGG